MDFKVIDKKFEEFALNIRDYFSDKNAEVLFNKRNVVKVLDYNGSKYVVKSFKIPHIINRIVYSFFRDTKAKKSYINSVRLDKFAPKSIAYIEFKKFGLLYDSYFISEEFRYDFTIREPLLDSNFEDKEHIFKSFANFTYQLHQEDVFHKDYSPGNILIKKVDDGYEFKIVDVNRMVFKTMELDDRLDNFSQLWAKDSDLEIIIKEYSQLANLDSDIAIKKALKYSQNLKDRKNLKKRLKGKKVVD